MLFLRDEGANPALKVRAQCLVFFGSENVFLFNGYPDFFAPISVKQMYTCTCLYNIYNIYTFTYVYHVSFCRIVMDLPPSFIHFRGSKRTNSIIWSTLASA